MKAVIWTKYGPPDVLQLREIPQPTPKENELLIKVRAATAFAGDCELRRLALPLPLRIALRLFVGLTRPKRVTILGQELAGEVEAVGAAVTTFKKGDAIFGTTGLRFGAYAQYACLPAAGAIAHKPEQVSFEEAAAIPTGGTEAGHYLRVGQIQAGEKILINGAGGSIGTFVVQLAKQYGAEVTAVDHGTKLAMLREIGADRVIDYTREDFATRSERYDLIFDSVGKKSFFRSLRALKPNGRYLLASPNPTTRFLGRWVTRLSGKRVIIEQVTPTSADLTQLAEMVAAGTLNVVIDKRFPLAETAAAHRYVETGQKKGHVIITVTVKR